MNTLHSARLVVHGFSFGWGYFDNHLIANPTNTAASIRQEASSTILWKYSALFIHSPFAAFFLA